MKLPVLLALLAAPLMGANDWLIVPGSRVGPVTASATHDDLIKIFGAANVIDEEVTVTDVGPDPGTVVFKNRPFDSLTVVWTSDRKISMIVPCMVQWPEPKSCHWHTAEGISIGTKLSALEKLNGSAFDLAGFGWDYSGIILDWKGGRLATMKAVSCGLAQIRLGMSASPGAAEKQLYGHLNGDRTYSSANPTMHALNPRVEWIALAFSGCSGHAAKPVR